MDLAADRRIVVGRIAGVFGIRGWLRVFSYTDPPDNILRYGPWSIGDATAKDYRVTDGSVHGRGIIAHLEGVDDREVARRLIGATIAVPRTRFGAAAPNEYYWSDLIGLRVVNQDGTPLGEVEDLLETGANDVLVVRGTRRRLLPFVAGTVVRSVDLDAGLIAVDWDPEF
jgi:16S rRNA processing protein RimM